MTDVRRLSTWPLAALLAGTVGCVSSVDFEDIEALEDYGTVGSAVWGQRDYTDDEGEDQTLHGFMIGQQPGLCKAYKRAFEAFEERMVELEAAPSGQAEHDVWMATYEDLDEHLGPHFREGAIVIQMAVIPGEDGRPEPGEHDMGSGDDVGADVRVDLLTDDLFTAIGESFYVHDDEVASSEPYCVGATGPCDSFSDVYTDTSGWTTLSYVGADTAHLEFSISLREGWNGDRIGAMRGDFYARKCVLPRLDD